MNYNLTGFFIMSVGINMHTNDVDDISEVTLRFLVPNDLEEVS